jgi:hypothetical protein
VSFLYIVIGDSNMWGDIFPWHMHLNIFVVCILGVGEGLINFFEWTNMRSSLTCENKRKTEFGETNHSSLNPRFNMMLHLWLNSSFMWGDFCDIPSVTVTVIVSLQYPHHVSIVFMQYKPSLSLKFKVQILSLYFSKSSQRPLWRNFKILHTSMVI